MRGRPRRAVAPVVVNIKLYLVPGEDDDLIAWLGGIQNGARARTVMAALRGGATLQTGEIESVEEEALEAFDGRMW